MKSTILALACVIACQGQQKKLYIESREVGRRNVTLEVTKALIKECPGAVAITESKGAAEFSLAPASKSSVLYKASGEVEHVFTARWTVSGLAREVCGYFNARP